MNKELILGLGALIGAVVSLIQVVMKIISERRNDAIAARHLGAAKEQIEVLAKWYNVKTQVSHADSHEELRSYVNVKLDKIIIEAEQSQTHDPMSRTVPALYRWLLLFFPRSPIGWLARILLIFCITFAILVGVVPVEPSPGEDPIEYGSLLVGLACLFGLPSILLYAASVWDGGRHRRNANEGGMTSGG